MFCGMLYMDSGKIKMENEKSVFYQNVDRNFLIKFLVEVLSRLDVNKIEIFFTGGFVDDSYLSAIMCGTVSSMVQSLYSVLSQKYENVRMIEDVKPTFNESNLELTVECVVSVSLFEILVSVIKANSLKKLKESKNEG